MTGRYLEIVSYLTGWRHYPLVSCRCFGQDWHIIAEVYPLTECESLCYKTKHLISNVVIHQWSPSHGINYIWWYSGYRKLGEGAFGTVYGGEAFINDSWIGIAVKTLKVGSTEDEKVLCTETNQKHAINTNSLFSVFIKVFFRRWSVVEIERTGCLSAVNWWLLCSWSLDTSFKSANGFREPRSY